MRMVWLLAIAVLAVGVTGCGESGVKNGDGRGSAAAILPAFANQLSGSNEVRVRNPNDFTVKAGIRSAGENGRDVDVPANGMQSVFIPDGTYDIYFIYSNDPSALFQGDSFTLSGNGVEIQIVRVVDGNYNIRQVN